MCPGTAAMLAVVGGVISAAGTAYAGYAGAQAKHYEAQVAQNNAIAADQAAAAVTQAGQQKAANVSLKEAEEGGKILAAQGASGVDTNTGSNRAVRVSQRELGNLDVQTTLHNSILQAYGYKVTAANERAQAGLYEYEAPQLEIGADIGAAGQVFGAAGKFYTPTSPSAPSNQPLNILPG